MAVFTDEELRLFDGYIHGTLAAGERLHLEQQLSSDKEVHNRFTLYHTIVHQIQDEAAVEKKLKERFKKLDRKQKHRGWFPFFAIAASIIGIVLFIFVLRSPQKTQLDKLAAYKVEEPGLPVVMGEVNNNNWTAIMQLYKQREYAKALSAVQKRSVTDTSLYFKGLFTELVGEKEKAINIYQQLQNTHTASLFKDKAQYRLAILLWERGEKTGAKTLLTIIAENPSHIYHPQAQKALQELSK